MRECLKYRGILISPFLHTDFKPLLKVIPVHGSRREPSVFYCPNPVDNTYEFINKQ